MISTDELESRLNNMYPFPCSGLVEDDYIRNKIGDIMQDSGDIVLILTYKNPFKPVIEGIGLSQVIIDIKNALEIHLICSEKRSSGGGSLILDVFETLCIEDKIRTVRLASISSAVGF